jgi:hypothetical protein
MYNHRIIIAGIKEDIEAICKYKGITDPEIIQNIRASVAPFDQNLQRFAAWLKIRNIEPDEYVLSIKRYTSRRAITNFSVSASAVKINDEAFDEELDENAALNLTEYIHANFPVIELAKSSDTNKETEDVPVVQNEDNSIRIFEVNDANDAIRLVGSDTSWCIGYRPPRNMWQSYRDGADSTFFVVFDNDPPTPEQRKVAIDFSSNDVMLTDIPNRTGKKLSNGMTWEQYQEYLMGKGIDLRTTRENPETGEEELILANKPRTEEEILQGNVFSTIKFKGGLKLEDVKLWQSGKSIITSDANNIRGFDPNTGARIIPEHEVIDNADSRYYLSRYLGLGHPTNDEVISYLLDKVGGEDVLSKYLTTGIKIPDSQYNIIKSDRQLLVSYLRTQIIACENSTRYETLDSGYFEDLVKTGRKDLLSYYFKNVVISYDKDSQLEFIAKNPEYHKYQVELKLNKKLVLNDQDEELLGTLQDKNLIQEYLEQLNRKIKSEQLLDFIIQDSDLLSSLTKRLFTGRNWENDSNTVNKIVPYVIATRDESLISLLAKNVNINLEEFDLANQLGVLDSVKKSVTCMTNLRPFDPQVFKYFDPENSFDYEIISKINNPGRLDFLAEYNPKWQNVGFVKLGSFVNKFYFRSEEIKFDIIPSDAQELVVYKMFNRDLPSQEQDKQHFDTGSEEKISNAISDFQNKSQDIDFWKSLFSNLDNSLHYMTNALQRGYGYNQQAWGTGNVSNIISLIPINLLDDPFFVDFITQHTTSVMYSHVRSVLRAKPDSWLLDLLATKTATEYNYNLVENLRAMRVDGQDDVAYKYLVKFFQKKEKIQNISFGVFENVDDLVFTLNALDDVYPLKDHPDYYFPLKDYLNNTELQLFLLRKYPTLLAENIKSLGSNVLSFIKPEVRAALVDMYPELTYTVGDYEKTTKQPIEYYDEEKQEVIPGNRPNLPETQATASILKLVKIAQKLDNKNYYKLADKFTNILRRYNVQS